MVLYHAHDGVLRQAVFRRIMSKDTIRLTFCMKKGLVSLKRKWQMKYGFGIKIIPDQSLAFLQYRFTDVHGEEIDMKEEIEIK